MVKMDKSAIIFSKNIEEKCRKQVPEVLDGVKPVQHSSLPFVVGRLKIQILSFIKIRMEKRLQAEKGKLLS